MDRPWKMLLVVLLAAIFAVQYQSFLITRQMAQSALFNTVSDPAVGEFVSAWKSGNNVIEVRTLRQPGQSLADWNAAHLARRAAKLEEFPPDS